MAEGKLKLNHEGQYVVEIFQMGGTIKEPSINLVTHVALAVELDKLELKEVYKVMTSQKTTEVYIQKKDQIINKVYQEEKAF